MPFNFNTNDLPYVFYMLGNNHAKAIVNIDWDGHTCSTSYSLTTNLKHGEINFI
jgi:hypothetical protein